MQFSFAKYQGSGNDFIIIDDRTNHVELSTDQIRRLCHRKFGIGADGLMLLKSNPLYDFEMVYFNADGNVGSMCGNGGRCLVKFASDIGIRKSLYHFIATDGEHDAEITDSGWIHLKMKDVDFVQEHHGEFVLNTGSPHYIKIVPDAMAVNVVEEGKHIRYNKEYEENGINVNFVEVIENDTILVRTYERGVEDETLSCGTGVTASALVNAHNEKGFNRIEVKTLGGKLAVEFEKTGETNFSNIWLCGPASFVFNGNIQL